MLQAWALFWVIYYLLWLEAHYRKELTGAATFTGASVALGLDIWWWYWNWGL